MLSRKVGKISHVVLGCFLLTSILLLNTIASGDDVPSFSNKDLEKYNRGSSFVMPDRNLDEEITFPKRTYSTKRPYSDITAILYMTTW